MGYLINLVQGNTMAGIMMETSDGVPLPGVLSLTGLMVTVAVFVFFKYEVSKVKFRKKKEEKIIRISKYTLTMYLVHAVWLELFEKLGITVRNFYPVVSVPILTIAVFLLSYISASILNKIGFYRKYIM